MKLRGLLTAVMVWLLVPAASWGCAVCFGDPNSSMTLGMNNAILTLLAIVLVVQGCFVALFVQIWKRGKRLRERREGFHLLDGGLRS